MSPINRLAIESHRHLRPGMSASITFRERVFPASHDRHRVPHAPSLTIRGKAFGGASKRGGTPRSGATRSTMLPVVGAAFQPEVMKPNVPSIACGSSKMVRNTYFGLSMGRTAVKVVRFLV